MAAFPYVWFKSEDNTELAKCLAVLLIKMRVKAILLYNPYLFNGFEKINNLFIYKRSLKRILAWPNEMDSLMEKEYIVQDGDGDAVFT